MATPNETSKKATVKKIVGKKIETKPSGPAKAAAKKSNPVASGKQSTVAVLKENVAVVAEEITSPPVLATAPAPAAIKIKSIEVVFNKVVRDANKRVMPVGIATATYSDGTKMTVPVSGGANYPTYGISDAVTKRAIFRVEKSTYKNYKGDPMPYALFYNGGEALHVVRLDKISHGCVHIADVAKMKKLNQDIVKNKTAVTVKYAPGILTKVMNRTL